MATGTAGSIIIELLMKTGSFETDIGRAEKRLRQLSATADRLNKQKVSPQISTTQQSTNLISGGVGGAGNLGILGKVAAVGLGVNLFSNLADEGTKLQGILQNASSENVKFGKSLEDVKRIADISQVGLIGVGQAYSRIANALQEFGVQQSEVSNITEALSLALKVNGATAQEASSVLIQLSQAFGKGKLDGDEFRSAMEAAPNVMRQLAVSMGVPFGALKDLAAQGKITSEELSKAFNDKGYLDKLRSQAGEMQTISGSIVQVRNSMVGLVASFDDATGSSKIIAGLLKGLAGSLDFIVDTLEGKPLDWKTFLNAKDIPAGMQVFVDPKTDKVLSGTIEEVRKGREELQKEQDKLNNVFNTNIIPSGMKMGDPFLGTPIVQKDSSIADYQSELKKQEKALKTFIDDKGLQSSQEKLNSDLKELEDSFKTATKTLAQDSPKYLDALKLYNDRKDALLGEDKKSKEEKALEKTQKEARELTQINKLLAQGVPLKDAQLIAKLKEEKINDKLIVNYLNLRNSNEALNDSYEKTLEREAALKEMRDEQIPGLKALNKLLAQGVPEDDAKFILDSKKLGLSDELIVAYLNEQKAGELVTEGQQKQREQLERLKKLKEDFLPTEQKLANAFTELNRLLSPYEDPDLYAKAWKSLKEEIEGMDPAISRFNEIMSQTESFELEKTREDMLLLGAAFDNNTLSAEQFLEAVNVVLGRTNEKIVESSTILETMFKKAAENAQSALADFLFDPFKEGIDGMLLGFVNVLKRMAAEALAAEIFKKLLGNTSTTGKLDSGSWLGQLVGFFGSIFGGGKASGGDVIAGREYLVGEQGPERFVPRVSGTIIPNNQMGSSEPANVNVKNINVLDPSLVGSYLNTDAGERVIMNIMQRNRGSLGF